MQLSDDALGDGDPGDTGLAILRAMGPRALPLARAQIARCDDRPDLAARWTAVVATMQALVRIDGHLGIALDLLDTLDLTTVAARLDGVIAELGVRAPPSAGGPTGKADLWDSGAHCDERVDLHLHLAGRETDLAAKGRHLDLASGYATLGELIERERRRPTGLAAGPVPPTGSLLDR